MATIAEQLTSLANTKTAIKDAIVAKGVSVADTDPFSAYAGKIGQIQAGGGGAPATKFGVSIDNLIGNVDADGLLQAPTSAQTLDLSGVKTIDSYALGWVFAHSGIQNVIANDVKVVQDMGFYCAFQNAEHLVQVSLNGLVEITSRGSFNSAFQNAKQAIIVFGGLKRILGSETFYYAFYGVKTFVPDVTFPVLEEISGSSVFNQGFDIPSDKIVQFTSVKKMAGGTASYSPIFGMYTSGQIWKFPNVTEITGYVFRDYVSEIHFAAANQAAIEACDGYDYKWGATNANIIYDL